MNKTHPLPHCVNTDDLARELKSNPSNLIVFDCRFALGDPNVGLLQYEQGHIPGAYFLDLEADLASPVEQHGGRHPLPRIGELQERLRSCGLTRFHNVIVYDDTKSAYAAHAWWLLRFMGLENVFVLDGGYQAWLNAGGRVDKREPMPRPGNFVCQPRSGWLTDYDGAKEISQVGDNSSFQLIDAREEKRFLGIEEPIDPVAGHIPNAENKPWQDVVDDEGFFLPLEFHQQRWSELADKQLVSYCGSGVTACMNLLSYGMVTNNQASVYRGSWSDWCSHL